MPSTAEFRVPSSSGPLAPRWTGIPGGPNRRTTSVASLWVISRLSLPKTDETPRTRSSGELKAWTKAYPSSTSPMVIDVSVSIQQSRRPLAVVLRAAAMRLATSGEERVQQSRRPLAVVLRAPMRLATSGEERVRSCPAMFAIRRWAPESWPVRPPSVARDVVKVGLDAQRGNPTPAGISISITPALLRATLIAPTRTESLRCAKTFLAPP